MKYSKEAVDTICNLVKAGAFSRDAAISAGICEDTFYEWKKKYSEFSELIKRAEAERKVGLILEIRRDRSWQSKAWYLERVYKDEFAPRSELELWRKIEELEKKLEAFENEKR